LIWIPASVFLGLALLAKGPVHLIFFYAIVISVCWQSRNWRLLLHPAHFVAIVLMLGIFAAWAVPFVHATSSSAAATKWTNQFSGRLKGTDFKFVTWVFNVPRGLVYFLPWTVFLPFVRPALFAESADQQLGRALVWGATVPFILVNLIPGSLPRYSMPALIPACWLVALTLSQPVVEWPGWCGAKSFSAQARRRVVGAIAMIVAIGVIVYACAIIPKLQQRQNIKGLAAQIDRVIPPNESVYALDPNYQPIFFYLRAKLIYVDDLNEVPAPATYLLARPERQEQVLASDRWSPRRARLVLPVTDYRKQSLILFKIE
jgi:4-amino-4-deoxy-L-arabinose transferase-like glycosyltransferase